MTAATDPTRAPTSRPTRRGLLAGMRIRKKLIVLHTTFSLVLAGVLMGVLRPALDRVVAQAEAHEARLALSAAAMKIAATPLPPAPPGADTLEQRRAILAEFARTLPAGIAVRIDRASALPPRSADDAHTSADAPIEFIEGDAHAAATVNPDDQTALVAVARLEGTRAAVVRLYLAALIALLTMYGLIALSLEVFVLPRHVYGPIRAMLRADAAAQSGDTAKEIIPEPSIPADELGEIMRSRNGTVAALRTHEADLARALAQLEAAASDLQKKNHLLEAAQKNLADADRLASLGVLSAGLAHELNTPLAVAKGLAEKLAATNDGRLNTDEAQLLVRVIGRLERLSESLLDFARVRPPATARVALRPIIDEAWTLVRLDREARAIDLRCDVDAAITIDCDADRMLQVFVNLLRNAVDATSTFASGGPIEIAAAFSSLHGRPSLTIRIADSGPGLSPDILSRLFEPFATTKLDARGTGLGLAVSQGIVREHAGLLTARNNESRRGAVFEIVLPQSAEAASPATHQSANGSSNPVPSPSGQPDAAHPV